MRVLVVGERYPDGFAENTAAALGGAGYDVTVTPPFRRLPGRGPLAARVREEVHLTPRVADWSQQHLVDAVEDRSPEVVLVLDFRVAPRTVKRMRAVAGAPVALWFPDSPGNLRRETHVLSDYDAIFFKDSELVRNYRELLGLNAHFLPEACNPRWHRPVGDVGSPQELPAVLVAGNVYPTRYALIGRLLAHGIRVEVFGPPWPRWFPDDPEMHSTYTGRYLIREEKARTFRKAPVVLNSLATHEADGLNCRLFEAAACGGVVLTEWRARLGELFSEREVRSYRRFDDLVDQIRQLVNLPLEDRRAMGDAASARAHSEHTYLHRFDSLVAALGAA